MEFECNKEGNDWRLMLAHLKGIGMGTKQENVIWLMVHDMSGLQTTDHHELLDIK